MIRVMAAVGVLMLPGCAERVVAAADEPPALFWGAHPEADRWTDATLVALREHGGALTAVEPANIEAWCPAYDDAPLEERETFWAGLLSVLAHHESTHRPDAVGGGGRWFGLTQIAPATADGHGCEATSGAALKDGEANLSCAVRIMAAKAEGDLPVRRIASDWGPFHSADKRRSMRDWVVRQSYCQV